jgi:hypothetical protein
MNTIASIPTKTKTLPLHEQMTVVQAEINAIDHKKYLGLHQTTIAKFKQHFGNCVFWYNQWDKNRDYSSCINAAMALGKLSTVFDLMVIAVHQTDGMKELLNSVNTIFVQCWDNIQKAAGRIVPFEGE